MNAQSFDWDDANVSHIWRHRVRPHEAEEAVNDPAAVPLPASRMGDEDREALVGMTRAGRLLTIVFTLRGQRPRVVTARRPDPREQRLYWRQ